MTPALTSFEHARAFAPQMIDVPSLNAKASEALLESIERVCRGGVHSPSSSLLVLGPAGAGKTHLFERLRRKVGAGATFVYVRPGIGIEASMLRVLREVVDALKRPVADREFSQLDVLIGSALALARGDNPKFPTAFLDRARAMSSAEREDLVQRALDRYEREEPGLEASWLELFFSVPFLPRDSQRAALAWLSGREPSEIELQRLGRTDRFDSGSAVAALRGLATVAAYAAPLVIVFDQLENLVQADGSADHIHAHARVYAELHDEVSRLVLVQMALDGEWASRISPELAPSERSRLESRVLHVELPTPAEREELLHGWLGQLSPEQREGAFPWPFSDADFQRLRELPGVTPRMLFVAARKALEGETPLSPEPDQAAQEPGTGVEEALAQHWQEALHDAHAELERAAAEKRGADEERLAAAVRVLLLASPGTQIGSDRGRRAKETLRFTRGGQETLVFVVQSTNGRSVATRLGHALKAAEAGKVVVVREQALALRPTWKVANENLEKLRRAPVASVMEVSRPDLAKALAFHDLTADARSQDLAGADGQPLAEAAVRAWAERALEPAGMALALGSAALHEAAEISAAAGSAPSTAQPEVRGAPRGAEASARESTHGPRGPAIAVLEELRLASLERVVAEVQRCEPGASRARVLAQLRAHPAVRWFGRTLVHLPAEAS